MSLSRSRKPKVKWTNQMNNDVLECKRRAQELVASDSAPLNRNGRKKGYIEVLKQLWEEKGYGHLALKGQNLRDQASRLEKCQEGLVDESCVNGATGISIDESMLPSGYSDTVVVERNRNIGSEINSGLEREDANQATPNLHTSTVQFPEELQSDQSKRERLSDEVLGSLPECNTLHTPSSFVWGRDDEGRSIIVNVSIIENAYDEISKWRKNTFLVPFGKTGKEFIDTLKELINKWNNGSEMEFIALKVAIVLLALCLQKPGPKSKLKDHQDCLAKRLALWKKGEVDAILREGRMIQRRLGNSRRATDPPNREKIFANLVMTGQVNSALRYLSHDQGGGILPLSDDVMEQLKEKHPEPQGVQLGSLVPDTLYYEINGDMVRGAALRTKGLGGPSGVDSNGFRRILTCKSFKRSGTELCEAIASMTKRLCTEYVDPRGLEAILANRLIPLDKGEGAVRPIRVGEVSRTIMGKCVTKVTKPDVIDASGSLQVCTGHKSGSEAAIHAMRELFEHDNSDAVLLIDASNAFNSLNRAAALHNIRVLCPSIATCAINTYREPARLFIVGGQELRSSEGTTQGDPLAMSLYAISLQPLITRLQVKSAASQCCYAEDATGCGSLGDVKTWWDELMVSGPEFMGVFPIVWVFVCNVALLCNLYWYYVNCCYH